MPGRHKIIDTRTTGGGVGRRLLESVIIKKKNENTVACGRMIKTARVEK